MKALASQLKDMAAHESKPQTLSTRLILWQLVHVILARRYSGRLLSRWAVQIILEAVAGMRVGETTGELHGVLANDICVLQDRETGEFFVDIRVSDSKTKHPRFVSVVGTTRRTKLSLANGLATLAKHWDMRVDVVRESAYIVHRFDYWVLRVSLLAISESEISALKMAIVNSRVGAVRSLSAYLVETIRVRAIATGGEEKKHVNLWGGPRESPQFQMLLRELSSHGVRLDRVRKVPGPLIRATCSRGGHVTHTAMDPKSTLRAIGSMMDEAYEAVLASRTHDPELDLMGREVPLFRNHANRRFADKVARDAMRLGAVSEVDIDIFFGWKEKEHEKNSQLHYAGESRRDRVRRSLMTRDV